MFPVLWISHGYIMMVGISIKPGDQTETEGEIETKSPNLVEKRTQK